MAAEASCLPAVRRSPHQDLAVCARGHDPISGRAERDSLTAVPRAPGARRGASPTGATRPPTRPSGTRRQWGRQKGCTWRSSPALPAPGESSRCRAGRLRRAACRPRRSRRPGGTRAPSRALPTRSCRGAARRDAPDLDHCSPRADATAPPSALTARALARSAGSSASLLAVGGVDDDNAARSRDRDRVAGAAERRGGRCRHLCHEAQAVVERPPEAHAAVGARRQQRLARGVEGRARDRLAGHGAPLALCPLRDPRSAPSRRRSTSLASADPSRLNAAPVTRFVWPRRSVTSDCFWRSPGPCCRCSWSQAASRRARSRRRSPARDGPRAPPRKRRPAATTAAPSIPPGRHQRPPVRGHPGTRHDAALVDLRDDVAGLRVEDARDLAARRDNEIAA